MANQKAISVAKFEGISWRMKAGVFQGQKEVNRKPFGDFTVQFKLDSTSGRTSVSVRSWNYEDLNKAEELYEDFNGAVAGVAEYFEEIDDLTKNVSNEAKIRAEMAYRREIAREIRRDKKEII